MNIIDNDHSILSITSPSNSVMKMLDILTFTVNMSKPATVDTRRILYNKWNSNQ